MWTKMSLSAGSFGVMKPCPLVRLKLLIVPWTSGFLLARSELNYIRKIICLIFLSKHKHFRYIFGIPIHSSQLYFLSANIYSVAQGFMMIMRRFSHKNMEKNKFRIDFMKIWKDSIRKARKTWKPATAIFTLIQGQGWFKELILTLRQFLFCE